ncbi:PREDICTED: uncharacterized protein LOC103613133 isoform X2 [Corvus brachyrhynchos]|uniref:uncharacterized protein LOC103613133 isoform X2 n=1 Tax=Corvus brachyrhynchos TaxID=85066 RepID=UPI00081642EF|nr:PREDICTED: uncharacterized protein LOC103613133 isoform X2 [Corvus brachyrhynchos]
MFWEAQERAGGFVGTRGGHCGVWGGCWAYRAGEPPNPCGAAHLASSSSRPTWRRGVLVSPSPRGGCGGSWGASETAPKSLGPCRLPLAVAPARPRSEPIGARERGVGGGAPVPRQFTHFPDYKSRNASGRRNAPVEPGLRFPSCSAAPESPVGAGSAPKCFPEPAAGESLLWHLQHLLTWGSARGGETTAVKGTWHQRRHQQSKKHFPSSSWCQVNSDERSDGFCGHLQPSTDPHWPQGGTGSYWDYAGSNWKILEPWWP